MEGLLINKFDHNWVEYVVHSSDEEGYLKQEYGTIDRESANRVVLCLLREGTCAWVSEQPWDDDIPF